MKILILGAGGFIGSHLVERLLAQGHRVVGVDTEADKVRHLLGKGELTFIQKDIRRVRTDVDSLVQAADTVVDLIAYGTPSAYVRRPLDVFHRSFVENLRVAESCVAQRRRLVLFSSCEVYGKSLAAAFAGRLPDPDNPAYATFSEDASPLVLGPVGKQRWIYACAKQLLERVLHAYGIEDSLNYAIVRPFNLIGPKLDLPAVKGDPAPSAVACFLAALLKGEPMKLVDGGKSRRCYTYIDDAVDAVARIVDNAGGVCDRQIFNIGNPANETTIRGLAELMGAVYREKFAKPGSKAPSTTDVSAAEFYGEGFEDADRRIPDIAKARKLLGWEPKTGLREAVEKTMASCVR